MKLKTSKYGKRPRKISRGPQRAGKPDAMSMQRPETRRAYEHREIEQDKPSRDDTIAGNKAKIDAFQSTMKPVRGLN